MSTNDRLADGCSCCWRRRRRRRDDRDDTAAAVRRAGSGSGLPPGTFHPRPYYYSSAPTTIVASHVLCPKEQCSSLTSCSHPTLHRQRSAYIVLCAEVRDGCVYLVLKLREWQPVHYQPLVTGRAGDWLQHPEPSGGVPGISALCTA